MNIAILLQERRRLLEFTRLLVSYGCAGVDQEADDTTLCGQCGPCEARAWLAERGLLEVPSRPRLTQRETEVLRELDAEWVRPMDVGGRDGNDVSRTLTALVRKGYAEIKRRAGHCRPSYLYRRSQS